MQGFRHPTPLTHAITCLLRLPPDGSLRNQATDTMTSGPSGLTDKTKVNLGLHSTVFATPRLLFRPLSYDYLRGFFAHKANPIINRRWGPHKDISQSEAYLNSRLRDPLCWMFVVHLRPSNFNDEDIGSHLLQPSEADKQAIIGLCGCYRAPEISSSFNPSLWGEGIASEALVGLEEAYWETFPNGHPCVEANERMCLIAKTRKSNGAGSAVLRKNGFELWKEEENATTINRVVPEMMLILRKWKPGHQVRYVNEGDIQILDGKEALGPLVSKL